MPSPTPKPNAHRRRGLDPRRTLSAPTRRAPRVPVDEWPDHVKKWWRDVWRHPVSSEWDTVADHATARRLGDLYALLDGSPSASLHAQAAKCEASLLLTPQARRSAYVVLPTEDDPDPEHPGPVVSPMVPDRWQRAGEPGRSGVNGWDENDPRNLLRDG